jgi:hypothetical protein
VSITIFIHQYAAQGEGGFFSENGLMVRFHGIIWLVWFRCAQSRFGWLRFVTKTYDSSGIMRRKVNHKLFTGCRRITQGFFK